MLKHVDGLPERCISFKIEGKADGVVTVDFVVLADDDITKAFKRYLLIEKEAADGTD